ncbi:MAG: hypothetical protein WDO17_25950 [Alphaproteobacteria bacterium]
MGYGEKERRYAEPFANALVADADFRTWVIRQTVFAKFAENARLLHEEMKQRRSGVSQNWWRSHFTETCRCAGCSGKETDVLAIFETEAGFRFALHIEVKHPGDKFKNDGIQSKGYPIRASCWTINPPPNVVCHHQATTVLLFSSLKSGEYARHLAYFQTLITFESLRKNFPHATVD